jgi:hypothetical protein
MVGNFPARFLREVIVVIDRIAERTVAGEDAAIGKILGLDLRNDLRLVGGHGPSADNGVEFVNRKLGVAVHAHSPLRCQRGPSPHAGETRQDGKAFSRCVMWVTWHGSLSDRLRFARLELGVG